MAKEIEFDVMPPDTLAPTTGPALSLEQMALLQRIENFARFLDSAVRIPGINLRIGADSVLGLVLPGIGDALTAVGSGYVVLQGSKLGLPRIKLARMVTNILVDTGVGAVPFAGDIFDVFIRANLKNVNIIREHFSLPPILRKQGNV